MKTHIHMTLDEYDEAIRKAQADAWDAGFRAGEQFEHEDMYYPAYKPENPHEQEPAA